MMLLIGSLVTLCGALFILLGAVGILRMPDVYNRMQAGTKASTLGSILTLAGIALAQPEWTGKMVLLILFILMTNPISTNALARAAHHSGVKLTDKSVADQLRNDMEQDSCLPCNDFNQEDENA